MNGLISIWLLTLSFQSMFKFSFFKYPNFEYEEIYIGCNRDCDKSVDNFEGLIGTFIFFSPLIGIILGEH